MEDGVRLIASEAHTRSPPFPSAWCQNEISLRETVNQRAFHPFFHKEMEGREMLERFGRTKEKREGREGRLERERARGRESKRKKKQG